PVEPGSILEADEELRIGGIRVLRAGHRAGAPDMAHIRELRRQVRLVGTAHSSTRRIERFGAGLAELHVARLGHETVYDAMEHHAVIGLLAGEFLDAFDMLWRKVGQELDDHLAFGRLENEGVLRILDLGHRCYPSCLYYWESAAILTSIMRSGSSTAPFMASLPFLMLSTNSIPDSTSPTIVYCPSSEGAGANMMKNCELAEFGSWARAIPTVPR